MTTTSASYVLRVHRSESIDELRPRVIELLKAEGFGILTSDSLPGRCFYVGRMACSASRSLARDPA